HPTPTFFPYTTLFRSSGALSRLLSPEASVQDILTEYLVLVPLSYTALGVCMLMVSVCNATGQPLRALLISVLRLFLCYLPLLWRSEEHTSVLQSRENL